MERLKDILERAGEDTLPVLRSSKLTALWEEVVDERVRKHTEAVKVKNGVLYVSTSSPAWAQELSFFKREIVEKFNRRAGNDTIKDVRFKPGGN